MTLYEEYDARYEAWQREQTLASLDDCGIILPMDTSSAAWRRDYGKRNTSSGSKRHAPGAGAGTQTSEGALSAPLPDSSVGITGMVNVFSFYAVCALIVGAVYVAVKVVAK